MPIEGAVTGIGDLNSSWPLDTDDVMDGDDHIRNLKVAVKSLLTDLNQIKVGPASLSGEAGKALVVNVGEDGFDEVVALTVGDVVAANNLSDLAVAATARTNLGLGTAAVVALTTLAQVANNLSDLVDAATARTNLGLGSLATLSASFVDRGDPSSADFLHGDLTNDATWRNLDLSSIVPAGAVAVLLRVEMRYSSASQTVSFRENGNSNALNMSFLTSQVSGITISGDCIVRLDANRIIDYRTFPSPSLVGIVVAGWWI